MVLVQVIAAIFVPQVAVLLATLHVKELQANQHAVGHVQT
jgi:hypothetical protein